MTPDCCLTCRGWRRLWSCIMPQSCCTSQQHCRQRTSSTLTSSLTTCYSGRLPAQYCQPGIPADLACGPKLACASLIMAELLTQLSCLQTPSSRFADKYRFLKSPETRSCEHALFPKYAADEIMACNNSHLPLHAKIYCVLAFSLLIVSFDLLPACSSA